MKIELSNLFIKKVKTGINVFTGAGFSVLPSPSGNKLPTGQELCEELKEKFDLKDIAADKGLAYISEFCPEQEYQSFLRSRFTVKDYNPLYDSINKLKMNTYVTTNIDNIIRCIIDKSSKYYLKSIREYGASMNGENELSYIPLHGDVLDLNSKLYFGAFDLATVDKQNDDLFDQMFGKLAQKPILFLGYGFDDKGVLNSVKRLIDSGTNDIWIQFLPSDQDNIKLFKSKGCHIIEADTMSFLSWIDKNIIEETSLSNVNLISDKSLKRYRIPTLSEVASIPQNEYYQRGNTGWHPILANVAFERKIVSELEDAAIKMKNVILTGCRFSGKTTTLMQLARKVNAQNKFYIDGIIKEEALFILNKIGNEEAWVFFNNCTDDIIAYNQFARKPNITIVGVSEEYHFETVKHLLDKSIHYKILNCSEIMNQEALLIYNKIPSGIRNGSFKYKETADEKFSMLEMIAQNVRDVFTRKYISKMLNDLLTQSSDMFTIVALASYLSENGSVLSYANVAHALNISIYPDALNLVNHTKDYLHPYNFLLDKDENDQDFFVLRSKLFALNVKNLLIEEYKEKFSIIIQNFILNESQYNIVRYNVFRRTAYDSEFFHKLFSKNQAVSLYKNLYDKNQSPYILQQLALCLASFGNYKEAFLQIDMAISKMPNNFSFKNSQAIIMFESNKGIDSKEAIEYMRKAMEMLRLCYTDDKRKIYHAQKFADFAIYFYEKKHCVDYLEDAQQWLLEMSVQDEHISKRTVRLIEKISAIRDHL